jgi:hypothetical protein
MTDVIKPIVHLTTKNMSFIKTYGVLKALGVGNNKFFLALYDRGLEYVDPHSPDLDVFTQGRISKEVLINPWYYLREVVRIPIPGGTIRFELHLGNLSLVFLLLMNINVIQMLPRQHGKTISTVCFFSYIMEFVTNNSKAVFSNKKFDDSKLNLKRYKDIVDLLPQWLLKRNKSLDKDNIESLLIDSTGNSIDTLPSPTNDDAADKLGRGLTIPLLWFDEFSFLKFNHKVYESSTFAVSEAALRARSMNMPNFKIITTTPNNVDVPAGAYCKGMIDDACQFTLKFFDMTYQEIKDIVDSNSSNDFIYIEFSYKELGRDDAWYRSQCRAVNNVKKTIKREIHLEWTKSSDTSLFSEEQLDALDQYTLNIIGTRIINEKYLFNFIKPFNPLKKYIMACDVAAGLSRDSSTIVIVDPSDLEPVGFFENNKIDLDEFENLIKTVANTVFPKSVVVIERSAISLQMLGRLAKSNIRDRLFYTMVDDPSKEKVVSNIKNKSDTSKIKAFGLVTSETSRNLMMDLLMSEINSNPHCFRMSKIIKQISGLERNKRGKIEHGSGMHDDVLMAYLFARYVLGYTKEINKLLVIDSRETASAIMSISQFNNKDNLDLLKLSTFSNSEQPNMSKKHNLMNSILNLNK